MLLKSTLLLLVTPRWRNSANRVLTPASRPSVTLFGESFCNEAPSNRPALTTELAQSNILIKGIYLLKNNK